MTGQPRMQGERWVTAREAADEVLMGRVRPRSVRCWAERGLIHSHLDRHGRRRFQVADLLACEARTRRRGRRRASEVGR